MQQWLYFLTFCTPWDSLFTCERITLRIKKSILCSTLVLYGISYSVISEQIIMVSHYTVNRQPQSIVIANHSSFIIASIRKWPELLRANYVNIIAADALASGDARPSIVMILPMALVVGTCATVMVPLIIRNPCQITAIDPSYKSNNAPDPTMHHFVAEMCTCVHFCYKMVHCEIAVRCIVGFVRWVNWAGDRLQWFTVTWLNEWVFV